MFKPHQKQIESLLREGPEELYARERIATSPLQLLLSEKLRRDSVAFIAKLGESYATNEARDSGSSQESGNIERQQQ